MGQADFLKVKKGSARVVIKTAPDDELPTMELDMTFTKSSATKLLAYALQLKGVEQIVKTAELEN